MCYNRYVSKALLTFLSFRCRGVGRLPAKYQTGGVSELPSVAGTPPDNLSGGHIVRPQDTTSSAY